MFAYLWSISQANIGLIFVFGILMRGITYGASNAIWPAFSGEMFDTRVRLSGMAIPTQIGFALAGFAPTIAAALQGGDAGAWMPVAVVTLAACVIAAGSAATAPETYKLDLDELSVPAADAVPSNLAATA